MLWFEGSIAEAVNLSKQKNAIFVVFVQGECEPSQQMALVLENTAVAERLTNQLQFLAIKLTSGSQSYTQFAQIYQFVPVPSLFFIGRGGTPLEVVAGGVTADKLAERIDRILQDHYKDVPMQPSTSVESQKKLTQDFLQSEASTSRSDSTVPIVDSTQKTDDTKVAGTSKAGSAVGSVVKPVEFNVAIAETTKLSQASQKLVHEEAQATGPTSAKVQKKEDKEYEVVCDGDVCVRQEVQPHSPAGPSVEQLVQEASPPEQSENIDEKLERAKELIEMRKKEKEDKEKELERQKELERRAAGQGVAELKRWQEEQQLKQIQEERKRERLENAAAKQKILDQIAQDRAERKSRDTPQPTTPTEAAPQPVLDSNQARIQIKLSDGTSQTVQLPADSTLQQLIEAVAASLGSSHPTFSLWTAFPRRELTERQSTLRVLGLAPSAALLVLPGNVTNAVSSPPIYAGLFALLTGLFSSLILNPATNLWNWIRIRFGTGGGAPRASSEPRRGGSPPRPSPGNVRYRGPSNVHRLGEDRNSGDDENNTWNGNSTQQM